MDEKTEPSARDLICAPNLKALTIWEPYASLILVGAKRIETRSWPAPQKMIGSPILIHAAKKWNNERAEDALHVGNLLKSLKWRPELDHPCHDWTIEQTLGSVLAVSVLTRCEEAIGDYSHLEQCFGTMGKNRFAWHLDPVLPLNRPVPVTGAQGLWKVRGEDLERVLLEA